ncbi:hypothetical protein SLS62_010407 [Diatrype stigma]|uniref:Impact N-terminal domain-containing protein n=1 Tax=Diatrype stigma TaxID=117547 RepID=A0AAN9UA40_9PEZI
MTRVKALQSNNLKSIQQIAEAPLSSVESAIKDAKAARTLHNACKARIKQANSGIQGPSSTAKRPGAEQSAPGDAKRSRISDLEAGGLGGLEPVSPQEHEASLDIPVETDEQIIQATTLVTNRAPLVLAFAVELLRHTMPEQPPSGRLSLAQAVVSANSRSKAVSIGLEKGSSAEQEGWGHGQPKVKVMGREVSVLKRSGYTWKEEEDVKTEQRQETIDSSLTSKPVEAGSVAKTQSWSASQPVTLKKSTFVVRAIHISQPSQRQSLLQSLFTDVPSLQTASHNAWAYRVRVPTNLFNATTIKEDSFDDEETGAGNFLLKNMRELDTVDTLVLMTRWYGGIMLGPDRWTIMQKCMREALAERLRLTGAQVSLGGEALWGLDLEAMKNKSATAGSASRSYEAGVVGMPVHRPEAAKAYLLKSFATRIDDGAYVEANGDKEGQSTPQKSGTSIKPAAKKKTAKALDVEKQENTARLLGAIRLLYDSWAGHLSATELDRRAWSWYATVRPEVEEGPAGWGAKGRLNLSDILDLRRKEG